MRKLAGLLLFIFPLLTRAEAPAIKLTDLEGRAMTFAEVQRDATLLAFWSSACVPCIEEMPLLEALHKRLNGDSHFAVIGVNLDDDSGLPAAKKILAERKVSYPMVRDKNRELVRKWFPKNPEQLGMPTLLVLDRKFHAVYSLGYKPGTSAATFIAAWAPRLEDARAGKLHEPLQLLAVEKTKAPDPTQMLQMIEKIVRSHHPELSEAEVKTRVDAAMTEFRTKGSFSLD